MDERPFAPRRSMVLFIVRAFEDVKEIAAAWAATFVIEASLAAVGLQRTLGWIERSAPPAQPIQHSADSLRRNVRAVAWAYRASPFPGTCLRRSLVQYWLGRRRRLPVEFVIGVRSLGSVEAHAWVESGATRSDGTPEDAFAVILRSPVSRAPRAESGERLCLACGLCCDGTLFKHVPVKTDEVERLRRYLPVVGSPPSFAQPCSAHTSGRCGIYADRPKTCVDFRCHLLDRYEAGELTEEEALETIGTIKSLAASVREGVPDADRIPLRKILDERLIAEDVVNVEWRRTNTALLVNAKLLDMMVKRHVLKPAAPMNTNER